MSECPNCMDEITAEWCTGEMRARGHLGANDKVLDISSRPLGGAAGFFSEMYALEIRTSASDAPVRAVAKLASETPFNRELGFALGYFAREYGFYADLASEVPLALPDCVAACFDPEAERFVLLMEDLSDGEIHEQYESLTPDQVRGALGELARLHGSWANRDELWELAWMGPISDQAPAVKMGYDIALDRLPDDARTLTPYLDLAHTLRDDVEAVFGALAESMETLVHADCRNVNLVFGLRDDPNVPVFIDWQAAVRGSGLLDVASTIVLGLPVEERRQHEDALVAEYVEALGAAGLELDPARAQEQYRLGVAVQFILAVAQFDAVAEPNQSTEAWLERAGSALVDHGLPALG